VTGIKMGDVIAVKLRRVLRKLLLKPKQQKLIQTWIKNANHLANAISGVSLENPKERNHRDNAHMAILPKNIGGACSPR
jgi:hypothetical protein